MVVLLPYKAWLKLQTQISEKLHIGNIKIISGMIFLVNIFHSMQEKLGVKKLANFPDYVPLSSSRADRKISWT